MSHLESAQEWTPIVLWEPQKGPQTWFLASEVYELLYGGAAGGGKTDSLLAFLAEDTEDADYRGLFLRKTYKALSEAIDRAKSLWGKLGAVWNQGSMTFTFPSGSQIEFGYLETWADTERYQGRQWSRIGYDELGQLAEERCWLFLMSRNRSPHKRLKKFMRASANPGGAGAGWIKRRFINICDRKGTPIAFVDDETGQVMTRAFIASRVEDNPALLDNDPGYIARLNLLPETLRKQLREGDWSAGDGLALGELNERIHLIPPFEPPAHWEWFGAFDWGFAHPFSFGAFAVDTEGTVYLVDSVHGRGLQPADIAWRVRESVPFEKFRYIDAGHDCFHEVRARGEATPTIAETFIEYGMFMRPASISRVMGLNNMRKYVQVKFPVPGSDPLNPEYEIRAPRFFVMDTPGNKKTWDVLTSMPTDPDHREDALKIDADEDGKGGDDPYDMTRYGLASRPITASTPEPPPKGAWHPDVLAAEAAYKRTVRGSPPLNAPTLKVLAELSDVF